MENKENNQLDEQKAEESFKNAFTECLVNAGYEVTRDEDGFLVIEVPLKKRGAE